MEKNRFFNHNIFALPHTLKINNKEYEVRTSFKNWIKLSLLFEDKVIPDIDKIEISLRLVFKDNIVEDIKKGLDIKLVFDAINYFFNCGENKENKKEKSQKIYDFKQDWDYIYSAFMQQYKIDLNNNNMHWFDFIKLFKGLSQETEFVKIVGYRGIKLSDVPKEQRKFYQKMKNKYMLQNEYKEEVSLFEGDANEILKKICR